MMNTKINKWIKANCQNKPTGQKLEFYKLNSDKPVATVYLKDSYQGYLTDDIDELLDNDTEWEAWGSDLYITGEKMEVIIIDTPITNSPLY